MVNVVNSKTVLKAIKNEPGNIQFYYVKKVGYQMCETTAKSAVRELIKLGKIVGDERRRLYIKKDFVINSREFIIKPKITEIKFKELLRRLYFFRNLKRYDYDPEVKYIVQNYFVDQPNFKKKSSNKLENEKEEEAVELLQFINNRFKEDSSVFLKNIIEPIKLFRFLERSNKSQMKISINTKQPLYLSNDNVNKLSKKISDTIFEFLFFNPEFLLQIKSIEDFSFNLNCQYKPLEFLKRIGLNDLKYSLVKPSNIKKLIDIIIESRCLNSIDKEEVLEKSKNDSITRNKRYKAVEKYERDLINYINKRYFNINKENMIQDEASTDIDEFLNIYFKFKEGTEKPCDLDSLYNTTKDQIDDYFNNIREAKKVIKDQKELIIDIISIPSIQEFKGDLNKDFVDLFYEIKFLEKENPFKAINKIDTIFRTKKLKNHEKITLYLLKSEMLCDRLKRYEEALDVVKEGLRLEENNAQLYSNKSVILRNMGELKEAIKALEEGLKIDKYNIDLLSRKVFLLLEIREIDEALQTISDIINIVKDINDLDSEDLEKIGHVLERKLKIHFENKNYEEVLSTYERLIEIFSEDIELYQRKTNFLVKYIENYDEALKTINIAIKKFPDDASLYTWKSLILSDKMLKFSKALKAVERGLAIDPYYIILYINKAAILSNMKKFNEAIETIEEAEKLENYNQYELEFLSAKAQIYLAVNMLNESYNISKTLLSKYPNNTDNILFHLDLLKKLGRERKAFLILEPMIEKDPNNLELIEVYLDFCKILKMPKYHRKAKLLIENALNYAQEKGDKNVMKSLTSLKKEIK